MGITLVAIEPDGRTDTHAQLSSYAEAVIAATLENYGRRGNLAPWLGYLTFDGDTNVGTCAFTMPPAGDVVEIAYYTFPGYEGKGYAQMAARMLVALARDTDPGIVITAHTLPEEGPSCQVLRNGGFTLTRSFDHPEDGLIWVWTFAGP